MDEMNGTFATDIEMEDTCKQLLLNEDLMEMVAIVRAIPDGIRLAHFPSHFKGTECWCRPQIIFAVGSIVINHKYLAKGEFDS